MRWQKVTLVGVGLLGGSLGLALKQGRLAETVVGYVRRPRSIGTCEGLQVVDRATLDLAEAVAGAELVVLCTPVAQMLALAEQMTPALRPGAVVTDVGSVKRTVTSELSPVVARAGGVFVGSHPMAGGEKSGVEAARADLFGQAVCVITPTANTAPAAADLVEGLWQAVGGRTLRLDPETHDDLVSFSSHLPHVLAATLARQVLDPARSKEQAALCASGFRDTTRIASSSPEMWRDIVLANRPYLRQALAGFLTELEIFRDALERQDEAALFEFFTTAKRRRDGWAEVGHSTD